MSILRNWVFRASWKDTNWFIIPIEPPYTERYVRWCERTAGEIIASLLLDIFSQELDTETDFYYYNARYYDPEVSRFVTADTVIDGEHATQGWNRYMYVKGNPIRYKDENGHQEATTGQTDYNQDSRIVEGSKINNRVNSKFQNKNFRKSTLRQELKISENILGNTYSRNKKTKTKI